MTARFVDQAGDQLEAGVAVKPTGMADEDVPAWAEQGEVEQLARTRVLVSWRSGQRHDARYVRTEQRSDGARVALGLRRLA